MITRGQNPIEIRKYPAVREISGARINGIDNKGLSTMGIPKMTVSLIFTKLGNKEIFAIRRLSCL